MDNPYRAPDEDQARVGPPGGDRGGPIGRQRPTSATVFGVLNLVFGGFGLLCSPFAFAPFFLKPPPGTNPILDLTMGNSLFRAWMIASAVLAILGKAAQLASGIGLLQLKPWGRTLAVAYAIFAVAIVLVNFAVFAALLLRPMLQFYRDAPDETVRSAALLGLMSNCVAPFLGLIYPLLMLFFLTRPHVVRAFQAGGSDDDPYDAV